jgi:hypothetical protein
MDGVLKKAKSGLTFLILFKILLKAVDLIIHVKVIRKVDKKEYGKSFK